MKRIIREGFVSAAQAAEDQKIRQQVEREFPPLRRARPAEAQRMHFPDIAKWKQATVAEPISGRFVHFRIGTIVLARRQGRTQLWTVQRCRWKGSLVPLANSIAGVPQRCLKL